MTMEEKLTINASMFSHHPPHSYCGRLPIRGWCRRNRHADGAGWGLWHGRKAGGLVGGTASSAAAA